MGEHMRPTIIALLCVLGCSSTHKQKDPEPADDDTIPQVPVPLANGPKLLAIKHGVVVRDRPSPNGKVIGALRAGAKVSRASEPYSKRSCAGGWYPIRPRGFVCAGEEATVDLGHPIGKVLGEAPAFDKALPYRFGRARKGELVLYGKLPTHEEQLQAEPKLADKMDKEPKRVGTGANDVPLNPQFAPAGLPVLLPDADGVGPDGYRTSASWFVFAGAQTPPAPLVVGVGLGAGDNRVLKHKSGVPVVGSFLLGEGKSERRFGVTPDGRFVPTDRLVDALGTTWHGVDLTQTPLPIGFALRNVHGWQLEKGEHAQMLDDEFEPFEAVPLTGRFRTVESTLYYAATGDEKWIRHKDMVPVFARHKYPDFATPGQKWVDISLANQTLIAFEGKKAVYATLVSTGQDRFGDPAGGAPATMQGTFRVHAKYVSRVVDDAEVKNEFSVGEVPWVLEFADGFAITASYWQKHFGEPHNFHNVTLSPIDAHWLWQWTEIDLPEGWHGIVTADDASSPIVYIHK
jgi:hypothetical protein